MTHDEALAIVREVERKVLENWQDVFNEAGCGEGDIRKVEPVFRPIPEYDLQKNRRWGGWNKEDLKLPTSRIAADLPAAFLTNY